MAISQIALFSLMLIAGMGVPVMAALNANLGAKLGDPILAAAILCLAASLTVIGLLAVRAAPLTEALWRANPLYYMAGVLFVFYIGSITHSAPRIGLGNAVYLVILGQLISTVIIDSNGWFGAAITPLTLKRGAGLFLIAGGVYLAKTDVIT